jgi:hypothetical protein
MSTEYDLFIMDDSGLLGLVDCSAYNGFVAEDWTYESLMQHFGKEMIKRSILLWNCGNGGGNYRVRVRGQITHQTGWRETLGEIRAVGSQLHLVSYTALTMSAQFNDCHLPDQHESDLVLFVSPDLYRVRIVQMYDPAVIGVLTTDEPHFIVELERGKGPSWSGVAWL